MSSQKIQRDLLTISREHHQLAKQCRLAARRACSEQRSKRAVCLAALFLGTVPSIMAYPFDKGPLLAVTIGSALLGTAYSLPPLRLKRFPVFAALCIIVVRGTLVNLGFYAHAAHAFFASACSRRTNLISPTLTQHPPSFYSIHRRRPSTRG